MFRVCTNTVFLLTIIVLIQTGFYVNRWVVNASDIADLSGTNESDTSQFIPQEHDKDKPHLVVPQTTEPEALFVVEVYLPAKLPTVAKIHFSAKVVQFVGPVVPTPEVQFIPEELIEINPNNGARPVTFGLKFLALPGARLATFTLMIDSEQYSSITTFVTHQSQSWYSFIILGLGLIMLFFGWKMWKVQKKHPALMSTRSLFLNFEALEKVRKQYFPDSQTNTQHTAISDNKTQSADLFQQTQTSQATYQSHQLQQDLAAHQLQSTQRIQTSLSAQNTQKIQNKLVTQNIQDTQTTKVYPTTQTVQDIQLATKTEITDEKTSQTTQISQTLQITPHNEHTISKSETESLDQIKESAKVAEAEGVLKNVSLDADTQILTEGIPANLISQPNSAEDNEINKTKSRTVAVLEEQTRQSSINSSSQIFIRLRDDRGREFTGTAAEITIGRKKENVICLTAAEVSRNHVVIRWHGNEFVLIPLTSTNLTTLNGEQINKSQEIIKAGDELGLGGTIFQIIELRRL